MTHVTIHSWDEFVDDWWQQRPAVIKTGLFGEMLKPDYFQALVACCDAWRYGLLERPTDVRLLGDGRVVTSNRLEPLLPRSSDRSLLNYVDRVSAQINGSWNLVVNSMQRFSPALFDAAKSILDSVYRAAGAAPSGLADCHLITGAYKEAPTRIHKDTATVFTLVLEGSKRIWVWPFDALVGHATERDPIHEQVNLGIDFADHLDSAMLLEGGPGDVLYWPADYWHCAESDGQPHASIHLASYTDGNDIRTLKSVLDRALSELAPGHWRSESAYPSQASQGAADGDDGMAAAISGIERVVAELPDRMQAKRLIRASAVNFEFVPPLREITPWPDSAAIATDCRFPALYAVGADGAMLLAANGHIFRIPHRRWLADLVDQVNAARKADGLALADICKRAGVMASSDVEAARSVISSLARTGILA
jgi:hypothetical protein